MPITKTQPEPWRDSPVAWFCELETARRRHDYERAAQAQRELRRLGVTVKYARSGRKGADRA